VLTVSQLERQRHRARALDARNALAALLKYATVPESYRAQMQARLEELWTEADAAMGGVECRP
jgi:hypothetical protein